MSKSVKTANVLEQHGEDGSKSTINIPLPQNDIIDLTLDEPNDDAAAAAAVDVKSIVEKKLASPVPVVVPISKQSPPSNKSVALSITACPSMPTFDVHSPVKKSIQQLFPPVLSQCENVTMAEELAARPPVICIETERLLEKVQDKPTPRSSLTHHNRNVLDKSMQNRYQNMFMQQRSGVAVPLQNQQSATNYNGNQLMNDRYVGEQQYHQAPVFQMALVPERITNGSNAVPVAPPPQTSGQREPTTGTQFHCRQSTNESNCVAILLKPFYRLAKFYQIFDQFNQSLGAMTRTDKTLPNFNFIRRWAAGELSDWSRKIVDLLEDYHLPHDFNVEIVLDNLIKSVALKVGLTDAYVMYIIYKTLQDAGNLRAVPILEYLRNYMTMQYSLSFQSDLHPVQETLRRTT